MSRKVKKESLYNGLREDGKPWPDVLIGIRDIACYMRMHPATISRWVREGRLPTSKDARNRRWTTKSAIDQLAEEMYNAEMNLKEAIRRIQKSLRPQRAGYGIQRSCGADWDGNGEQGIIIDV